MASTARQVKLESGMKAAEETKKEEVPVEVEPKTGVSFPVRLDGGKQLSCVGLRKKSMLGLSIKIHGFGIYTNTEKLKDLLKSKFGKAPAKPTKELYQAVVDSDVEVVLRSVVVFSSVTMSLIKKNFEESLSNSIKKLTGKKNDELAAKAMGSASDDIEITVGSELEVARLPGYVLQSKVMGQMISRVDSELLCRAYVLEYLGDDPVDKEAKENFGKYLLTLF